MGKCFNPVTFKSNYVSIGRILKKTLVVILLFVICLQVWIHTFFVILYCKQFQDQQLSMFFRFFFDGLLRSRSGAERRDLRSPSKKKNERTSINCWLEIVCSTKWQRKCVLIFLYQSKRLMIQKFSFWITYTLYEELFWWTRKKTNFQILFSEPNIYSTFGL